MRRYVDNGSLYAYVMEWARIDDASRRACKVCGTTIIGARVHMRAWAHPGDDFGAACTLHTERPPALWCLKCVRRLRGLTARAIAVARVRDRLSGAV